MIAVTIRSDLARSLGWLADAGRQSLQDKIDVALDLFHRLRVEFKQALAGRTHAMHDSSSLEHAKMLFRAPSMDLPSCEGLLWTRRTLRSQ